MRFQECQIIWMGYLVQHFECQSQKCGLVPVDGWAAISEAGSLPWRVAGSLPWRILPEILVLCPPALQVLGPSHKQGSSQLPHMNDQPYAQPSPWHTFSLGKVELGRQAMHLYPQGPANLIAIRLVSAKNQPNHPDGDGWVREALLQPERWHVWWLLAKADRLSGFKVQWSLPNCVTMGKLLNFSVLQFSH